ncbi:MAG: N-formylglutamate amidohydrolase [Proteobacteria bacterium]|nr:N-formylglutamate amidohydrolase [Pseudomonadota bacterium]MBU2518359.1 N-formylglutamate amidohydrolase [Pseudomonadota bacterium]
MPKPGALLPLVITLPHCSDALPPQAAGYLALGPLEVEQSVDLGSSEVFGPLPALRVLPAPHTRLVADLNRSCEDLGPKGVVAAADYAGRAVFAPGQAPDDALKRQWVELFWRPWHRSLALALEAPGVVALLDGHSLDGVGPAEAPDPGTRRADVVLGNRGGPGGEPAPGRGEVTCPPRSLRLLGQALEAEGLSVAYNAPYFGGHIVAHYGPLLRARGAVAVQMELNKDLYADSGYRRVYPEKAAELSRRLNRALEWALSRW